MTLTELQAKNNYTTDKGTTHTYLEVYDELFKPFQHRRINLLEVGVATGGSLKLWDDYFSEANIWGIDIIDEAIYEYSDRVKIRNIDINLLIINYLKLDIAIYDGSHLFEDQITFMNKVWPHMRKDGLMIIEDVHSLEENLPKFLALGINFQMMDMRDKGTHDNVLLIFKK